MESIVGKIKARIAELEAKLAHYKQMLSDLASFIDDDEDVTVESPAATLTATQGDTSGLLVGRGFYGAARRALNPYRGQQLTLKTIQKILHKAGVRESYERVRNFCYWESSCERLTHLGNAVFIVGDLTKKDPSTRRHTRPRASSLRSAVLATLKSLGVPASARTVHEEMVRSGMRSVNVGQVSDCLYNAVRAKKIRRTYPLNARVPFYALKGSATPIDTQHGDSRTGRSRPQGGNKKAKAAQRRGDRAHSDRLLERVHLYYSILAKAGSKGYLVKEWQEAIAAAGHPSPTLGTLYDALKVYGDKAVYKSASDGRYIVTGAPLPDSQLNALRERKRGDGKVRRRRPRVTRARRSALDASAGTQREAVIHVLTQLNGVPCTISDIRELAQEASPVCADLTQGNTYMIVRSLRLRGLVDHDPATSTWIPRFERAERDVTHNEGGENSPPSFDLEQGDAAYHAASAA